MDDGFMRVTDTERWTMELGAGLVRRLPAAREERWLAVLDGRVWLTADGRLDRPADDVWLERGEGFRLPRGVSVVVEGAAAARLVLLEDVPQRQGATASRVARASRRLVGVVAAWMNRRLRGGARRGVEATPACRGVVDRAATP